MKLVRFGAAGKEKPGIIDSKGKIRDLSKIVKDIDGEALSPAGLAKIKKANIDKLPLVKGNPRLGPCVARPSNFIAIGLNYADHAAEAGMQLPPRSRSSSTRRCPASAGRTTTPSRRRAPASSTTRSSSAS